MSKATFSVEINWEDGQATYSDAPGSLRHAVKSADEFMKINIAVSGHYKSSDVTVVDEADPTSPFSLDAAIEKLRGSERASGATAQDKEQIFSFRAETTRDMDQLADILKKSGIDHKLDRVNLPFGGQSAEVKGFSSSQSLLYAMSHVEDGHVMMDTLRDVPVTKNSLERKVWDSINASANPKPGIDPKMNHYSAGRALGVTRPQATQASPLATQKRTARIL